MKERWRTLFSPKNFVHVLRTTITRHMVSFIDFYFYFLANFQALTSPHTFSIIYLCYVSCHAQWAWVTYDTTCNPIAYFHNNLLINPKEVLNSLHGTFVLHQDFQAKSHAMLKQIQDKIQPERNSTLVSNFSLHCATNNFVILSPNKLAIQT